MELRLIPRFKRWWHCLINLHRGYSETEGVRIWKLSIPLVTTHLSCDTCGKSFFGKRSISKKKWTEMFSEE